MVVSMERDWQKVLLSTRALSNVDVMSKRGRRGGKMTFEYS